MPDVNYAEKYLEFLDFESTTGDSTWTDFFDWVKVPEHLRSDYLIGCILKQVVAIIEAEEE